MPDDREIPPRKVIKTALRELGLSVRQSDALLRGGYKMLVGETKAENQDLHDQLERLAAKIH